MNVDDLNLVCKYQAGSHAYGLETSESDVDWRGIYLQEDLGSIIDPYKYTGCDSKAVESNSGKCDEVYHELRHFFHILRAGNSNAVEALFMRPCDVTTTVWNNIRDYKHSLLDPNKFYFAMNGYMDSEVKFATGQRTGKLGAKRASAIEKHGFSPKNFVQLFRLCWAGTHFFKYGEYPIRVVEYNPFLAAELLDIKKNPVGYTKEGLLKKLAEYRKNFNDEYYAHKHIIAMEYHWNQYIAAEFMWEAYKPVLERYTSLIHMKRKPKESFWAKLRNIWYSL